MTMMDVMASRLRMGQTVTFHPHGHSMEPLVRDGDEVTIHPLARDYAPVPGAVVLVTVHGTTYLHKVLAVSGERVQIGNNKGHINGWTHVSKVWGVML